MRYKKNFFMKLRFFLIFVFLSEVLCAKELPVLSPDDPEYKWMDALINEEFIAYESSGITKEMLDITQNSEAEGWGWARFSIVNSKIYGSKAKCFGIYKLLHYLITHYDVPDVEFVYLAGDGLLQRKLELIAGGCGPSLVSAKNKNVKTQILFCDWLFSIDDEYSGNTNWRSVAIEIEKENELVPWDKKLSCLFWRGSASGFDLAGLNPSHDSEKISNSWRLIPRLNAAYLSNIYPNLLNARMTFSFPFLEDQQKQQGLDLVSVSVPLRDHLYYKFQLCLDGHTCTYPGYQWRLLSKCCTFKQETPNIQWFYPRLKPWIHYIPINEDLSDLIQKIRWAISHDTEVKKIAENAHAFGKRNVMPEHVALYCYKTLVKYASLQKFKPEAPQTNRTRRRR